MVRSCVEGPPLVGNSDGDPPQVRNSDGDPPQVKNNDGDPTQRGIVKGAYIVKKQ